MIQSTPNYIVSYEAINARNQKEEGTILSPIQDCTEVMEGEGYRKIKILSSKVNK